MDGLSGLKDRQRGERQPGGDQKFLARQRAVDAEQPPEARQEGRSQRQEDGNDQRAHHPPVEVGEHLLAEDGAGTRAHIQRAKHFRKADGEEHHHHGVFTPHAVRDAAEGAVFQEEAEVVSGDLDGGQVHALPQHVGAGAVSEDALVFRPGLAAHQIALRRLHAQGQARQSVRHHVDPQQVDRRDDGEVQNGGEEDDQHLRQVGGELELQHLADVVVDLAAGLRGADAGGDVVVRQHHVGGALRHRRAGDAHADADVGFFYRGRVVDAVTGHGGHHAPDLPGVYDARLVLRLDTGVDAVEGDDVDELLVGILVQLRAQGRLCGVGDDAQVLADGHGGVLVVAGDHDGADAGHPAFLDGLVDLRPAGINHAVEADQDHVMLQRVRGAVLRHRRILPVSARQHAQGLVGVGFVDLPDLVPDGLRHGDDPAVLQIPGTAVQNDVGSALGVLDEAVFLFVDRGHHLAVRVEGSLGNAGLGFRELVLWQADLVGIVYQGGLRGLAGGGLLPGADLRVRAQRHGYGQ